MKKLSMLCISVCLFITLIGCQQTKQDDSDSVTILCPVGAPALAFVSEYENITKKGKIDFVDGSDTLVAELVKKDSEYDIIIAPINLGAKLIQEKQSDYRMSAIITWGNLYYVGTHKDALQEEGELALFGQGSVPQKIVDTTKIETALTPTYYSSATLVQQRLLANQASVGLLAEPLASATIAKAKQNNMQLEIIKDLQKEYGHSGYPQAAIFVKENKHYDTLFDAIDSFTNNDYPNLQDHIEQIGIETLKLPSVEISVKSITRQNIHFKKCEDVKEEIKTFLQLFKIPFNDDMIAS